MLFTLHFMCCMLVSKKKLFYRYDDLFIQLKNAYQNSADRERRLQILTLSPFGIQETKDFFTATY